MRQSEDRKGQAQAVDLTDTRLGENGRRLARAGMPRRQEEGPDSHAARCGRAWRRCQADRDTAERALNALLSEDYNEWMDVRVEPTEALLAIPQTWNLQESWRRGLEQRPDLQQARLQIEIQTKQISLDRNQLYPQ